MQHSKQCYEAYLVKVSYLVTANIHSETWVQRPHAGSEQIMSVCSNTHEYLGGVDSGV